VQRKIIQLVDKSISRQPAAAQANIHYGRTRLLDFNQLANSIEYRKFITEISKPHLAQINQRKARIKWLEPLTIYDYQMNPVRENAPRGLAHELALPHGASDCLIINPDTRRVLVNIRKDDGYFEGIGGHKSSGLSFRQNMLKELLEEVFSLAKPGTNGRNEFQSNEDFLKMLNKSLPKLLDCNLYEVNRFLNINDKGGILNIHISAPHILAADDYLVSQFDFDPKSSAETLWYAFTEIDSLLADNHSKKLEVLRVLWRRFKQSAYYLRLRP
jgi:hypothetical protein